MNILLIAYYYPPIQSGGTDRPRRMAAYLPRFGHAVTVLTQNYKHEAEFAEDVIRIPDITHNRRRTGISLLRWLSFRALVEAANRVGFYLPIYSFWKNKVIRSMEKIIEISRPELIIASYPPIEDLEIGLKLSRKLNIPLVSDFRDGLLFEPIEAVALSRYRSSRKSYQRIEAASADRSEIILAANPGLRDYFVEKYGHEKTVLLTNGYDENLFQDLPPLPKPFETDCFHLVHAGGFAASDATCDIRPFIDSIQGMIRNQPELKNKLRIQLIGPLTAAEKRMIRSLQEAEVVRTYGIVAKKEALAFLKAADALFLITSKSRVNNAPGKIFEYLACGKPILAITPDTFAARIIRETGSGRVVPPDQPKQIRKVLFEMIEYSKDTGAPSRDLERIKKYSASSQMKELAAILSNLPQCEKKVVTQGDK